MPSRKNSHRKRIRRSNYAKLDLIQIWLFVAKNNSSAADKLLIKMNDQMQRLAHTPRMGRIRNDVRRGLYSFPVAKYVIFYTIDREGITIVRVLHSARDVASIL